MEKGVTIDELYMGRCLELAALARQTARPNPMVGAVIVHNGKIIGEGYHRRSGEPHAEVNAVASVVDNELLREATIYVSLEPCSHHGKTPPCADLLVKMGFRRVVVGTVDPFPQVSGRGIERLRAAGIDVSVGVLEEECRQLNRFFFHFQRTRQPYVVLKWAQSADGFMDAVRQSAEQRATAISSPVTQVAVHKLRAEVQSILVGSETARLDNPSLTVRAWVGESPLSLVVDRGGKLSAELRLFDGSTPTIAFCRPEAKPCYEGVSGVEVVRIDFDCNSWGNLLNELGRRSIQSVLVEGGATILQSLIDAGCWQEAHQEVGVCRLIEGVAAPQLGRALLVESKPMADSLLLTYRSC